MQKKIAGGCMCGTVRYEIAGAPFRPLASFCHTVAIASVRAWASHSSPSISIDPS
jgi:hypothetical protein